MDGIRGVLAETVSGDLPGKFWPDAEHPVLYERSVNLTAGPSGVGKSLITVKQAADISRTRGNVIYCNAEDDPVAQALRLRAAGADMSKIRLARFILPDDLASLREAIIHDQAKLVIFDTAAKHINAPVQRWDRPLSELRDVLAETDCAAMYVHHTNKNVRKSADWRAAIGGATSGLIGTARTIALVGKNPADGTQVILCPVKDANDETPDAIAFDFDTEDFDQSDGRQVSVAAMRIAEKGIKVSNPTELVHVSGGDGQRGPSPEKAAEAAEFLTNILAAGPMPVADVNDCTAGCGTYHLTLDDCPDCGASFTSRLGLKTMAEDACVSWGTVKRAKAALTIESSRKMSPHHKGGRCSVPFWRLPDGHPSLDPSAPRDLT